MPAQIPLAGTTAGRSFNCAIRCVRKKNAHRFARLTTLDAIALFVISVSDFQPRIKIAHRIKYCESNRWMCYGFAVALLS